MLLVPSFLLVLCVCTNDLHGDFLHSPLRHWDETDSWLLSPLFSVLKVTFALFQS